VAAGIATFLEAEHTSQLFFSECRPSVQQCGRAVTATATGAFGASLACLKEKRQPAAFPRTYLAGSSDLLKKSEHQVALIPDIERRDAGQPRISCFFMQHLGGLSSNKLTRETGGTKGQQQSVRTNNSSKTAQHLAEKQFGHDINLAHDGTN